jgi:hypothetical protein
MASRALTTSTSLQCPHGGTVSVASSNQSTQSRGFVLRDTDTFTVAGCPLTTPGGTPIPCVTVRWVLCDLKVQVLGAATLSEASIGVCLNAAQAPQGTVVVAGNAGTAVSTV